VAEVQEFEFREFSKAEAELTDGSRGVILAEQVKEGGCTVWVEILCDSEGNRSSEGVRIVDESEISLTGKLIKITAYVPLR